MSSILLLVLGFLLGRFWNQIISFTKQALFLIRNYKMIKKSKYYNDFYEDYISSQDYERGDVNG